MRVLCFVANIMLGSGYYAWERILCLWARVQEGGYSGGLVCTFSRSSTQCLLTS